MWNDYNKTTRLMVPDENMVRFFQKKYPNIKKRKKIKVLDAGFASGRHLVYLSKQGFQVSGFDYSEESLRFAKKWLQMEDLSLDIRKASIFNLPYEDSIFDVFVEIGMIEHFRLIDRKKAIAEAHRVLKPGGYLFLNVKKRGDYLEGSGPKIEKNTYLINESFIKGMEYHFFDEKELRGLLAKFRKVDLDYIIMSRNNKKIELHNWVAVARK